MKIDENLNCCVLSNCINQSLLNSIGAITALGSDLSMEEIIDKLEFFPSKQIAFNETFYGLKQDEKTKIYNLLKKQKINYINITSNIEEVLDADYIYVYDKDELVLEGKKEEVLKEEKKLKKLGFGLPFVVDLSLQLQVYDVLDKTYYDLSTFVEDLWN